MSHFALPRLEHLGLGRGHHRRLAQGVFAGFREKLAFGHRPAFCVLWLLNSCKVTERPTH